MKTCKNCNTPVEENTAFCPNCGTKEGEVMNNAANTYKLHCPHCKSTNITITTESSVNGAVSSHHGAFSTTSVSNTHRNFWICTDCGTKFRNIQSLEEEIAKSKNTPTILTVIAVICAVLSIYLIIQASSSMFGGLLLGSYCIATVVATIIFLCGAVSSKKKFKKMQAELAFLKENCFN